MQTTASKHIELELTKSEEFEIKQAHAILVQSLDDKELEELPTPEDMPTLATYIDTMFYMTKQVTVSKTNKKVITAKLRQFVTTYNTRAGGTRFIQP